MNSQDGLRTLAELYDRDKERVESWYEFMEAINPKEAYVRTISFIKKGCSPVIIPNEENREIKKESEGDKMQEDFDPFQSILKAKKDPAELRLEEQVFNSLEEFNEYPTTWDNLKKAHPLTSQESRWYRTGSIKGTRYIAVYKEGKNRRPERITTEPCIGEERKQEE